MNPEPLQSYRLATTSNPHSHPKLRRAASHAVIRVGLAKLRRKRSSTTGSPCNYHHPSTLLPRTSAPISSHSLALIETPTSAPLSPSVVVLANVSIPSTSNQPLPDSGPLPTHLAQLYGIHYIGDPNQDPNLDNETLSDMLSLSSPTRPRSASITASTGNSPGSPASETDRLDASSISDNSSDLSSSSSPTPPPLDQRLPLSSPLPTPSNLRRLTPRSCRAAFPPIDLESRYAPHAPTPPLSPPPVVVPPGSNKKSGNHQHKHNNSFHLPKTLRKLPSTASMFRRGAIPFGQLAHKTASFQSSDSTLSHHHHVHSFDSVKTRSKDASLDTENESETLEEITSLALRPSDSRSCTSFRSTTPVSHFKTLARTFGFTSRDDGCRPLHQTESCLLHVTATQSSSHLRFELGPELDRTITRNTGHKTFAAATARSRTFSSLSGIFKSSSSKQHQTPKATSSSSRRPLSPTPASDVHANISSLLSPGPELEILDVNSH